MEKTNQSLQSEIAQSIGQVERLAALSALAAGIAHEIAQPLTSIKLVADSAIMWHNEGQSASQNETLTDMKAISRQVDRIDRIMQHLRSLVYKQRLEMVPCDFNVAVKVALSEIETGASAKEIYWSSSFDETLPLVLGNEEVIGELVINLTNNAIKALSKIDQLKKTITIRTIRSGDSAELEISDNGPGIDEAVRGKMFETFFTTDATGIGIGLGLSIVKAIVAAHNGGIAVFPNQPKRTTFRVTIPLADITKNSNGVG